MQDIVISKKQVSNGHTINSIYHVHNKLTKEKKLSAVQKKILKYIKKIINIL